ncbi:hypothetical protein FB451DRAFT_284034 [Mycena latifolia]|nr:hypothetical protein FB451DRAFT_284034 [Mycena latifolia]
MADDADEEEEEEEHPIHHTTPSPHHRATQTRHPHIQTPRKTRYKAKKRGPVPCAVFHPRAPPPCTTARPTSKEPRWNGREERKKPKAKQLYHHPPFSNQSQNQNEWLEDLARAFHVSPTDAGVGCPSSSAAHRRPRCRLGQPMLGTNARSRRPSYPRLPAASRGSPAPSSPLIYPALATKLYLYPPVPVSVSQGPLALTSSTHIYTISISIHLTTSISLPLYSCPSTVYIFLLFISHFYFIFMSTHIHSIYGPG